MSIIQFLKKIFLFSLCILSLSNARSAENGQDFVSNNKATYAAINAKSWEQIVAENTFQWRPPFTVHLPIQPVHSPDFIYIDCALNASRRRMTPNVSLLNKESYPAARQQETFVVQFAFEDPPFVPDFRQSTLSLAENKYPVVAGDFFAWDLYYKIEYACSVVDEAQSLLWMRVTVRNEGEKTQQAHVRAKINFQPENKIFDYHYIPFYWDASKWLPCDRVSLKEMHILKDGGIIGKIVPGSMRVEWEQEAHFQDKDYNKKWGGHNPYFVTASMRLQDVQDVIHATGELKPGQERTFSLALLTNDEHITKSHLAALEQATAQEVREQALRHFKSQFTEKNTQMRFPWSDWQDILTELQISTLQLLVKFPDKMDLMPTQGGSSERFFVWVWEAVHMLRPMLRTGQFEPVRQALDYIFSLQDAGCPPEGRFTTTQGAIGTTGPKWMCTTGAALALAGDYYIYSHDQAFLQQYLPKILRAGRWIIGELRTTRTLNADGSRPLTYGLMPFGWATDGDVGYVVSMSDGYTFWGLEKTVQLLERIKHDDAAEFRRELEQYRTDIAIAVKGLAQPDGFIERKILTDDKETMITKKFANVVSSAMLGYTGAVDPSADIFRRFIDYYEKNRAVGYFMGNMDREIAYIGTAEYIWQHIYLTLGEWKKAFAATQVNLKYGMTQDTYQVQERFSRRNPAFTPWQPNGSGNGRMMDMMLNSLWFESGRGVTLLGAVPFAWLRANRITALKNLYTPRGRINLEIAATDDACTMTLTAVDANALPHRIRVPEYFHAVSKSAAVFDEGRGLFNVKTPAEKIVFVITDE